MAEDPAANFRSNMTEFLKPRSFIKNSFKNTALYYMTPLAYAKKGIAWEGMFGFRELLGGSQAGAGFGRHIPGVTAVTRTPYRWVTQTAAKVFLNDEVANVLKTEGFAGVVGKYGKSPGIANFMRRIAGGHLKYVDKTGKTLSKPLQYVALGLEKGAKAGPTELATSWAYPSAKTMGRVATGANIVGGIATGLLVLQATIGVGKFAFRMADKVLNSLSNKVNDITSKNMYLAPQLNNRYSMSIRSRALSEIQKSSLSPSRNNYLGNESLNYHR